jgi:CRP-like cAMP-binding protein
VIYGVSRQQMHHVLCCSPDIALCVFELLCCQLTAAYDQAEDLVFQSAATRLARTLVCLARRHEGQQVFATHEALAAMIGSRQDEVSKLLRHFRTAGLICSQPRRRGIRVLDLAQLAAL